MTNDTGPQKIGDLFSAIKTQQKKPPAYEWQDLALRLINELGVPPFKKGSIFKICKEQSKEKIEKALNETKELCKAGERWKYFFKVIDSLGKKDEEKIEPKIEQIETN